MQTRTALVMSRNHDLNRYGITHIEEGILFAIQAIGNKATPSEISRWLLRKPHSIFDVLRRMERKGLIINVKDLDRKNLVRVGMTEKGWQIYSQVKQREAIQHPGDDEWNRTVSL